MGDGMACVPGEAVDCGSSVAYHGAMCHTSWVGEGVG